MLETDKNIGPVLIYVCGTVVKLLSAAISEVSLLGHGGLGSFTNYS